MSDFERIFENNRAWVGRKVAADPGYFTRLARGQEPRLLYIGCSDSRVTPEEIMGVDAGELFVHRNIANLVIGTDVNLNAVVQYAIEHLGVKHIIVCGHYECGGVKAALHPADCGQLNGCCRRCATPTACTATSSTRSPTSGSASTAWSRSTCWSSASTS